MGAIRGIVFDFGGVMTQRVTPDLVRPILRELGLDWSVLERGFARHRSLMDGDFITLDEMYARIWQDAGVTMDAATQRRISEADIASYLDRNERTLAWMRTLKARGFRLGILTNMYSAFAVRFRERYAEHIALADALVISGEVRLYKPMREIYDRLREGIALDPAELCFIDDVEANCQAARDAGWSAIRFIDNAQAERDLDALLASR